MTARRSLGLALIGLVALLAGAYVSGNAGSIGASKLGSLVAWIGLATVLIGLVLTAWSLMRHTKSSSGVKSN